MPDPAAHDTRRRFPRLRENCKIRVRPLSGFAAPVAASGDGVEGVTVNISGGGLCYRTAARVETGDFLAIEMLMPEFSSPVVALGRVAWVEAPTPPCDVGVEFWWVGWGDDAAQRAIADYIKSELRHEQGPGQDPR